MSLFYEEKKLVIDVSFFVPMANFPWFLLRNEIEQDLKTMKLIWKT